MAPPSEFDLRAALADGEGEGLNPDELILAGRTRRAQRRNRLLTTAAVVALVAGGAVGIGQLDGGSGGAANSAVGAGPLERKADRPAGGGLSTSNGAQYAPRDATGTHALTPTAPAQSSMLADVACPSRSAAGALVQHGAKSTRAQASTALFAARVSSVVVCAYGSTVQPAVTARRGPARLDVFGNAATRLTSSMEHAGLAPNPGPCGQGVANRFAVVGVGPSGAALKPVTVDLVGAACAPVLSNGVAVRYDWVPPPDLARRLSALTPTGVPAAPTATPSS